MECTISVIGGDDHPVTLPADATYADAVAAVDCSPQAATALVDGHPVPNDAPVEAERIEVVQLIRGG